MNDQYNETLRALREPPPPAPTEAPARPVTRSKTPEYRRAYRLAYKANGRRARGIKPAACETCGAPDSRDARHQRGCPALAPLTRAELVELACRCAEGWREDERERAERARGAA